jgi:hypothetical protein
MMVASRGYECLRCEWPPIHSTYLLLAPLTPCKFLIFQIDAGALEASLTLSCDAGLQ